MSKCITGMYVLQVIPNPQSVQSNDNFMMHKFAYH